ncbi:MAG TPA: DUF2442 domain-containing protein [Pseudolabrys sp.]|jgi:hypothetical protein|nr:DUF2442 domain-containing protein [Pseudolabrys sp.]
MLPDVIHIEGLGGFRLHVRFNDGSEGVHDFTPLVSKSNPGPMRKPLCDEAYFAKVFIELGAPTWPNGFDICPDYLHQQMEAAGELTKVAT